MDNALELFLKSYAAKFGIQGYKQKLVPELLNLLLPHIPELAGLKGDLQVFHDLRDAAYHLGLALDDIDLNWGIEKVKGLCAQVEQGERRSSSIQADGGMPYTEEASSPAERELEGAVRHFWELPSAPNREEIEKILASMFRAVEYWMDDKLKNVVGEEVRELSLSRKIEILRNHIKDPVLLDELKQIVNLRNALAHSSEVRIDTNVVYNYLQVAMHFIKIKSPSRYGMEFGAREAEIRVREILERHGLKHAENALLEGCSRKTRFDFVILSEKIVVEVRHAHTRRGGNVPEIFLESLAFRIIDLKRTDARWRAIVVLSGNWSRKSEEFLRKNCDYVVMIDDLEELLDSISSRHA